MQASVFESGWQIDELMRTHRQVVAPSHQGKGRAVLSLDWSLPIIPIVTKSLPPKRRMITSITAGAAIKPW